MRKVIGMEGMFLRGHDGKVPSCCSGESHNGKSLKLEVEAAIGVGDSVGLCQPEGDSPMRVLGRMAPILGLSWLN